MRPRWAWGGEGWREGETDPWRADGKEWGYSVSRAEAKPMPKVAVADS